jgi:DNA modification methylase
MRYLVKLVTPERGVVLDPYLGSGTTAVAAKLVSCDYVGCELNPEYIELAESRLSQGVLF